MGEGGPVDAALSATERGAVLSVGHAATAAVGPDDVVENAADAHHHGGERCEMGRVVDVDQDADVLVRQGEATQVGRKAGVVDDQEPRHGLLLQPLPGVPGVDACSHRQLVGRQRTLFGEHVVEVEPAAQVDAEQLQGCGGSFDEPLVQ